MIETASRSTSRLTLPPEKLYWAVVEAKAVGRRNGRMHTRLGYLFEVVIPEPIEQVHATYVRVTRTPSSPYLACGMNIQRLEKEIQHNPGTLHLGPEYLPDFVVEQLGGASVPVAQLNLLQREFEPAEVCRLRSRWLSHVLMLLVLASAVLILGLERRVKALSGQTRIIDHSRSKMINDTVSAGESNRQPPDVRLVAELRRLRQSRGSQTGGGQVSVTDQHPLDCAPILAELLQHWPSEVVMMTDSIVLTPTSIAVRGLVPSSQDVQALAHALGGMAHAEPKDRDGAGRGAWLLHQPQMSTGRDGVQVTLQLNRSLPKGGPS